MLNEAALAGRNICLYESFSISSVDVLRSRLASTSDNASEADQLCATSMLDFADCGCSCLYPCGGNRRLHVAKVIQEANSLEMVIPRHVLHALLGATGGQVIGPPSQEALAKYPAQSGLCQIDRDDLG